VRFRCAGTARETNHAIKRGIFTNLKRLAHSSAGSIFGQGQTPFDRIGVRTAGHGPPDELAGSVGSHHLVEARPSEPAPSIAAFEPCTVHHSSDVSHRCAAPALAAPFPDPGHVRDDGPDGLGRGRHENTRLTFALHCCSPDSATRLHRLRGDRERGRAAPVGRNLTQHRSATRRPSSRRIRASTP